MNTMSHCRGSEESHNKKRKYAKVDGIRKRMSQEEINREMAEINIQLSYMEQQLQSKVQKNQRQGWSMKKKFKWPVTQLFEEKMRKGLEELKHRLNFLMQKEKLKGVEFRFRPLTKAGVHYCETE